MEWKGKSEQNGNRMVLSQDSKASYVKRFLEVPSHFVSSSSFSSN